MEEDVLLSEPVMVEEEVKPTDDGIGALATIPSFVRQEVNLAGECLAVDAEHCTLPRCQEVDGPRLQGVRRIVHLLGVIEGVVSLDVVGVAGSTGEWWGRSELAVGGEVSPNTLFALLTRRFVVCSLQLHYTQVFQCVTEGCRLLSFRPISHADNGSTVLLTLPAKIRPWQFHHYNCRHQCSPQVAKGGVCHWINCALRLSCFVVDSPNRVFRCA